jgi:hypothetical protein
MFMPPYTPEFNCIEALWSVIKRDFKKRVLAMQQVEIGDALFRQLLQESLDAIKPAVQKKAARSNNRGFIYLVLGKLVAKQNDLAAMRAEVSNELDSLDSVDSVDEEIRLMEEALDPVSSDASIAAEVEQAAPSQHS